MIDSVPFPLRREAAMKQLKKAKIMERRNRKNKHWVKKEEGEYILVSKDIPPEQAIKDHNERLERDRKKY